MNQDAITLAAALVFAAAAGGILVAVAMLLGLYAGVRIRQGYGPVPNPLANLEGFLEKYTKSREATAAAAKDQDPKRPGVTPQRKL